MPDLLLELFSEEIPARMQARAAADLERLVADALASLGPTALRCYAGPRRIAVAAQLAAEQPAATVAERGPRTTAPDAALAGFLRKHAAGRDELVQEGGFWVLRRDTPPVSAATLIGRTFPVLLRRFPWPKSMRWGAGSGFLWVRPLRRILCLLDSAIVPFTLEEPGDDGHHLASANITEGHRFHAPTPFAVTSAADWIESLRARQVIAAAAERRSLIRDGLGRLAAAENLSLVPDDALLDEVAGLVEWPVPLLGRIDPAFMDLPAEVMQVSMRVNQRYFALRDGEGRVAPRFAFVANIEAQDGGAAITAGNERVLRARFSDARHFWDLDRKAKLESRVTALDAITFHAKLGSQGARVRRLERLAREIAPLVGADPDQAARAAHLAKADLTTGMVAEFPELQGVMGGYYARHDGEDARVGDAIRDHYAPRGPADPVPTEPVTLAVALADKIDQLCGFFAVGEIPTGSSDPFALRRAALGLIRIVTDNGIRLHLLTLFHRAASDLPAPVPGTAVLEFIADRLRVKLRAEGARHDVLAATFAAYRDDDLVRLLARTDAVAGFLATPEGADLLAAARRAANILRIENRKDGPHDGGVDSHLWQQAEEQQLWAAQLQLGGETSKTFTNEDYTGMMRELAKLRPTLDAFFERVTVNAPDPALRANRLRLLASVNAAMHRVADFSQIEA